MNVISHYTKNNISRERETDRQTEMPSMSGHLFLGLSGGAQRLREKNEGRSKDSFGPGQGLLLIETWQGRCQGLQIRGLCTVRKN